LKLHLHTSTTQKIFTAHGKGYVSVSGERFEQPIVVTPDQVLTDWKPQGFAMLDQSHFAYFVALKPQVLLLGTGSTQQFAHPSLYHALADLGIGLEFMDTAAACRTYNILMAENRKVVAAILL
jgi:uncharacterized protein